MAVKIVSKTQQVSPQSPPKKSSGHTKAKAPLISLNGPGRLRVAHVMSLLATGHSCLYAGIKSGRYPPPDGHDGKRPFWDTATILAFLQRNSQTR